MAAQFCGCHHHHASEIPERYPNEVKCVIISKFSTKNWKTRELRGSPGLASSNGRLSDPGARWFVELAENPPCYQTPVVYCVQNITHIRSLFFNKSWLSWENLHESLAVLLVVDGDNLVRLEVAAFEVSKNVGLECILGAVRQPGVHLTYSAKTVPIRGSTWFLDTSYTLTL